MLPRYKKLPLLLLGFCAAVHPSATLAQTAEIPSPRMAVESLYRSILSADEKSVRDLLVFDNDGERRSAEAMLHRVISTLGLRRALIERLGQQAQDTRVGRKELDDAQTLLKQAAGGQMKIDGTTATVTLEKGPAFFMVLQNGAWKINYGKTQQAMGATPTKVEVETAKKQAAAIDQLAIDVKAGKVADVHEAETRFDDAMTVDPAPESAPAEK